MKKIVYLSLSALALFSFTFSSCEKSDSSSSDEPIKKLVKVVEEYDEGARVVREINYDDEGRVASVSVVDDIGVANFTYEYGESEIIMTREESIQESVDVLKYILGASSLPIKSIYTIKRNGNGEDEVTEGGPIMYDPNGYLVDLDGFVNITWKDGNAIKLDYGTEDFVVIDYTDSTHPEPLISKFTNYDFDNWFYLPGQVLPFKLKLSGHLPIHLKHQGITNYECSYSWKFDADGYPTEVRRTVVGENLSLSGVNSSTLYFNWE